MAAQALYRRWRPQSYSEISGQEHVTRTLRNALLAEEIAHAYLFAGPRGTGKTSTARILAKAVNCLAEKDLRPCNECARCQAITEGRLLDLIEIDAASNRGIDEVRDLREKVGFVPNEARYKVYILDEAHMLTEQAFNALLKTLEEPPEHVIFVMVTTEAHKIPLTIRSRCQRFDFRPIPLIAIVDRLQRIIEEEGLDAEPAALEAIALSATGSMRDAISLLDQLRSYGHESITPGQVEEVLGGVSELKVQTLVDHLIAGDVPAGLGLINEILWQGVEVRHLLRQLVEHLRRLLLIEVGAGGVALNATEEALTTMAGQATSLGRDGLLRAVQVFNQAGTSLRFGTQAHLTLELAFIEAATALAGKAPELPAPVQAAPSGVRTAGDKSMNVASSPPPAPREAAPTIRQRPRRDETRAEGGSPSYTQAQEEAPDARGATEGDADGLARVLAHWDEILSEVRSQGRFKAEAALRSGCEPVAASDNVVTIAFLHAFSKGMIEEAENLPVVEGAICRWIARPCRVRCVLRADWSPASKRGAPSMATASAVRIDPEEEGDGQPVAEEIEEIADPVVREAVSRYGGKVIRESTGR